MLDPRRPGLKTRVIAFSPLFVGVEVAGCAAAAR